jgi:hypothetical protein
MTEVCQHKWVDEYYGTKCVLCETFYPFGCAPWDDQANDLDEMDEFEEAANNCCGSFTRDADGKTRFWCGAAGSEDCDWSCPFSCDIGKTRRQIRDQERKRMRSSNDGKAKP